MDTAHPQKFPFILDRNLVKANCIGNPVCTSCDKVVLDIYIYIYMALSYFSIDCLRLFRLSAKRKRETGRNSLLMKRRPSTEPPSAKPSLKSTLPMESGKSMSVFASSPSASLYYST